MGCISSKEMIRSASYHQHEMKQRSQRTSKGREDLLIPRKGSNHFLALVCTATSMSDAFQSKSLGFESPVSTTKTEANEDILKPDGVDDEDVSRIGEYEVCRPDPHKRPRSWHSFPSEEMMPNKEDHDVTFDSLEVKRKGAIRSRSFHTVEKYDKLLERIWFATFSDKGYTAADPVEKETSTTPTGMNYLAELNNADSQDTLQPLRGNRSLAGESRTNDETVKNNFPGEPTPGSEGKDREEEPVSIETDILSKPNIKEDDPQGIHPTVKGSKRKSIARGLEKLKIPSTFELPAVASLREWLPGGLVFSPGHHPTPKFGSYIVSIDTTTNISEESIFNKELVTALEEQLHQLKAEEETILKQIRATWEEFALTEINEDIAIIS